MQKKASDAPNIKRKILIPLSIAYLLVLVVFIIGVTQAERNQIGEAFIANVQSLQRFYDAALEERAYKLQAILTMVADDPIILRALKQQDREALLARARVTYQYLMLEQGITHFYFHGPDRVNLLRVHKPDQYGDIINRMTLKGAELSQDIYFGSELGKLGIYTLRMVKPVIVDGQLLGYIELGEDQHELLNDIGTAFGVELFIVLDKAYLNKPDWEVGMQLLEHTSDWDRYKDVVVISPDSQAMREVMTHVIKNRTNGKARQYRIIDWNGRSLWLGGFPLVDASDHLIGQTLVVRDATELLNESNRLIIIVCASALLLGLLFFGFAYIVLARIEKRLAASNRGLRVSQDNLINAQRVAQMGSWDWDIENSGLLWSDEVYRIFGVTQDLFDTNKDSVIDFVHPDDRENFQRAIDEALEGKPYNIRHRIIRPDGEIRTVHELGELIYNAAGEPTHMLGTVQDVTEQDKAEIRLHQSAVVFDNTAEGIIVTDPDERIITVNKAFTDITGYSEEEVLGKTTGFLKSDRHDPNFFSAMWTALKKTGRWRGEIWNRRKNGEVYPEWLNLSTVKNSRGEVSHYVAVFSDITSIKKSEEQLAFMAHSDPLTGLPNRILLRDRLKKALSRANRQHNEVVLFFIDLDNFKIINDTMGHDYGDQLLKIVSDRLIDCVRDVDTVARHGGDEFVVLLEGLTSIDSIGVIAQKIIDQVAEPLWLDNREIIISASVGISVYPNDGDNIQALMRNADTAMYQAKKEGRNTYHFYTPEMSVAALERLSVESALRRALEREELHLLYQPQIDARTGEVIGVEALIRWHHPEMGLVPPDKFIPLAEENGLIVAIGEWVLNEACEQAVSWLAEGFPPIRMAVNISGRQITRDQLFDKVTAALETTGMDPTYLELEITETAMIEHTEQTIVSLKELKTLGLSLSLDDFGTGFSSLNYLKRFPIDRLKIDKTFVDGIADDPDDAAMAKAIIAIAHSLNLSVIAEGVETIAQQAVLQRYHCDEIQGYLVSKPISAEEVSKMRQGHGK